ncbi:MAG: YbaN family protein [Clostridiales bacterium]|nr:YbaN family protein [uncultured Anaerosporobacter sp.]MBS5934481.1 YbaN family protein [Clostridiales bacterium]
MKRLMNSICVGLAFVCVGLGAIGVVLPFVPATPFLLLATVLFAKGSERFHKWFIATAFYQKHIVQVVKNKTMTYKSKITTLIMLGVMFIIGFLFCPVWYGRVVIVGVALGHFYYFVFRIKTSTDS